MHSVFKFMNLVISSIVVVCEGTVTVTVLQLKRLMKPLSFYVNLGMKQLAVVNCWNG